MKKNVIALENYPDDKREELESAPESLVAHVKGVGGDSFYEPIPHYIKAKCEKVIEGSNNAYIVLGRDRPRGRLSGYGGAGHTRCGAIDLVAGRMSANPKESEGGEKVYTDNNFETDAARIYISQKTDIDENFNLAAGDMGKSVARSAIGIKADAVRIIGREGIKLVTWTENKNSLGGNIVQGRGIEIIACNDDRDLQPMVKGENAREAFERLVSHVDSLSGIVDSFLTIQDQYNNAVCHHFHISPFFGIPDTPSPIVEAQGMQTTLNLFMDVKTSLMSLKANLTNYRNSFFQPFGNKYINSRWNKVN